MNLFAIIVVVTISIQQCSAHGHMSLPRSRPHLAFEVGLEWCPWCILWDVTTGLEPYANLPYPGSRPFAHPGEGHSEIGSCGKQVLFDDDPGRNVDYNYPQSVWGGIVDTFQAGQVIEVEWLADANHLGVYSYRMCQDANITSLFTNQFYVPNQADYDNAEKCFQEGILPCNAPGLTNQNCAAPGTTFGCQPGYGCDNKAWFGQADERSRVTYRDQVRLPDNFRSEHTLLTWRWDALDTPQVYQNCADIRIV